MLNAYREGKDLYSVIGTKVYKNNYEDNREFYPDGTPNPSGKKRRSNCKSILLGIMYGRGAASIAEQIGSTTEEAQSIVDTFYKEFPKVKTWVDKTESDAKKFGYVEDLWGRRRRLPDIQLPKYVVKSTEQEASVFNPLLFTRGIAVDEKQALIESYHKKLANVRGRKEYEALQADARKNNISISDNGGFISRAERQCVNARIQGGAASMSKRAMIALYNDPEMHRLGFKLLIMVHDELIGECPIENLDEVKQRLSYWMEEAGKPEVSLPMKCDAVEFSHWYLDEYSASLQEYMVKLTDSGKSKDAAFSQICEEYCECTPEQLKEILKEHLAA